MEVMLQGVGDDVSLHPACCIERLTQSEVTILEPDDQCTGRGVQQAGRGSPTTNVLAEFPWANGAYNPKK